MTSEGDKKLKSLASVLENYSFDYFQRLDSDNDFPVQLFDELKLAELLSHEIKSENDFTLFSRMVSLIGEKSVAAALCWVMHNQQFNSLIRLKPDGISYDKLGLIASMTSTYSGKWHGERDKILETDGKKMLIREAPIVSYGRYSDSMIFTFPKVVGESTETWLGLTLTKNCWFDDQNEMLTSVRSTVSEPCELSVSLDEVEYIGPLSTIFSEVFVPIAHIGWMSAYNGGLTGVLSRLRGLIRNSDSVLFKKKISSSSLSKNRLAKAVSIERTNRLIIDGTISSLYSNEGNYSIDINSVKTRVSESLLEAANELDIELGVAYAIMQNDALGLEIYSRDIKAARLMFNNDDVYDLTYKHWLLKM